MGKEAVGASTEHSLVARAFPTISGQGAGHPGGSCGSSCIKAPPWKDAFQIIHISVLLYVLNLYCMCYFKAVHLKAYILDWIYCENIKIMKHWITSINILSHGLVWFKVIFKYINCKLKTGKEFWSLITILDQFLLLVLSISTAILFISPHKDHMSMNPVNKKWAHIK